MWFVMRALCFLLLWVAGRAICNGFSGKFRSSGGSCIACEPGWYCPDTDTKSVSCPAGTFCSQASMTAPTPCTAGDYCPVPRMDSPAACPSGKHCPSTGLISPLACPTGSYCPTIGLISPIACPAGRFCPTMNMTSTTECPAATYCPIKCPAGHYCPTTEMISPIACPAGNYCPATNMTSPGPACPTGTVCPTGTISPTTCPAGSYCPSTQMVTPFICPSGTFCPKANMTLPTTCPAGNYCPNTNVTSPIACPAGCYCPAGTAFASQYPCPPGYYCPVQGLTNGTTFPCPPGYFCPSSGLVHGKTFICPAGSYCPSGSLTPIPCDLHEVSSTGAAACVACQFGTMTVVPGSTICLPCNNRTAAATCSSAEITWMRSILIVHPHIGSWNVSRVRLTNTSVSVNASCAPVFVHSGDAITCTLTLMPPHVVDTSIVATVSVEMPSSITAIPLNMSVAVIPASPISAAQLHAFRRLAPLQTNQQLYIVLPETTPSDEVAILSNPPAFQGLGRNAVKSWVNDMPCKTAEFSDERTVVCHTPSVDGHALNATVELYGAFNLTGVMTDVVQRPMVTSSTVMLPAEPQQTLNATVGGVDLCAGEIVRISNVSLCGVPCTYVQCVSNSSIQCLSWPLQSIRNAAAHPSKNQRLSCDMSASWRSSPYIKIKCEGCITVIGRPILEQLSPPRVSGPGEQLLIAGSNFHGAVDVTVGGQPCQNVSRLFGNPDVLTCTTPDVPGFVPGYPRLPVSVSNVQGVPSTENRNVLYPAAFGVQWATPLQPVWTLSGFSLKQPPTLHILHRDSVSCSVSVEPSSIECPHTARSLPSRMQSVLTSPIVLGSTGGVNAANATLPLLMLVFRGERGCMGALTVSCVDSTGRAAATSEALSVSIIAWNITAQMPYDIIKPITPLAIPAVTFNITTHPNSHLSTEYRCMYALINNQLDINGYTTLEDLPTSMVLMSGNIYGDQSDASSSVSQWHLRDVSVAGIDLNSTFHLHIECQTIQYDERVRMPVIIYVSPAVTLTTEHTSYAALTFDAIHVNLTLQSSIKSVTIPEPECTYVIRSTSSRLLQLNLQHMQASRMSPASWHITFTLQLEGPSDNQAYVEFQCALWTKPHIISSSWIRFESIALHVMPVPPLPQLFLSSDAGDPVAVQPPLQVHVDTTSGQRLHNHVEVTCSLSTITKGTTLVPFGGLNIELYSTLTSNINNTVLVPQFGIQAPSSLSNVTLQLRCVRDASGETLPPFSLQLTAIQLRSSLCDIPVSNRTSGEALPSFRVAIGLHAGGNSCNNTSSAAAVRAVGVGSIVCSITPVDVIGRGGNSTSNNTDDMLSSVFTQQATQLADPSTMFATFDRLMVFAPPSFTYKFAVECTMGSVPIPPAHLFTLHISGCSPGMERRDVFCVSCGTSEFSMGTGDDGVAMLVPRVEKCAGCPRVGADCLNGLLLLKQAYYRPPERMQDPFGPDTALYPCFNGKACVVNSTTFTHGCSEGYTGPICSVCDVNSGYARSGEECALCGNPAASTTIVIALVMLVLAYLLRTALKKDRDSKTKAAITLKIAIGYMQAVGSLKSFAAGGTALYRQLMGWTDAVAASPLSVAALQCVWDASHIARYVLTVLLPVVACATVIACVVIISALKHVSTRKKTAKCDIQDFAAEMRMWIQQKRYFSTFLFVLFLSYMAIMGASLRVFDCYEPIEGVVYLRQDMRVECGSSSHVAAVVVAILTLLIVGIGFPALVYWVVGRSTPQQLADTTFFQQWGFLYDGYRSSTSATISKYTPRHLMWWEAVVLCRKVGVVFIAVLVKNAYMQNGLAALWLGGALILHIRTQPYTDVVFNRLETMSLASSCCIAIISSMLLQNDVTDPEYLSLSPSQMSSSQWLVTIAMILLTIGTFVCFAGLWLYYFMCQVREKLNKSPHVARLSHTIRRSYVTVLHSNPITTTLPQTSQYEINEFPKQPVVVATQPPRSSFAPVARWKAPLRSNTASKNNLNGADSERPVIRAMKENDTLTENPLHRKNVQAHDS